MMPDTSSWTGLTETGISRFRSALLAHLVKIKGSSSGLHGYFRSFLIKFMYNQFISMNLTRSLRVLLSISLVAFLISCEGNTEDDLVRIGFSQCLKNHPFREAMNHSMKIQASLYPNAELTIYEAHNDVRQQMADIEKLISKGVDVLIVSPIEPDTITTVIDKALELGIPVVLIDRKINSQNFTTYVGADNIEVGKNAGNYIAARSNKRINVIEIRGGDNSSPVLERSEGFRNAIGQFPNIHLVASINGGIDGTPKNALFGILDSIKGMKIDYVYAFNDQMAFQAWQVAREKGMEKQIDFIGVDGLNGDEGGIELVRRGILKASILYPTGGAESLDLAMEIVRGGEFQKINLLGTTVIDERNADIMKFQFDKINQQQEDIENQTLALRNQEEKYYAQNNLLKTTMALLAIILSLTIYSIYSIFAIQKKNRRLQLSNRKITIQKSQIAKFARKIEESNEAKLNFFTGLSHEIKTPITLIMSSVESIAEIAKERGTKIINEVHLIYNNSNRLLRLINNLLDFRKVEDKKFNLRASKTNLYVFSQSIFNDFSHEAKKRNIAYSLSCEHKDLSIYFDRNLMDKVYFNLLSNAFKFTPDNGKVCIEIRDEQDKNTVSVHFRDSGIGIPKDEIKNVFKPFFKGSNNRKNSSGIGLHLSKAFIELHKGKVEVRSLHGTEFIVTLYKGNAHFDEDELIVEPDLVDIKTMDFSMQSIEDQHYLLKEPDTGEEKYSILIIEDNLELSTFLGNKLKVEYHIYLSDGTDAIEKSVEIIPDIIVCDIMLPTKSGFQICEELKRDLRTSHIPIIVLTALGNKESYLQGLESGADLYLTKPFSYSILVQSIKTLLYNREKLRYYYTNNIYKIEKTDSFGNMEQMFIGDLNTIIKENLDDSDFTVENLASSLNISRVQLYRKVKAILGVNISDYIGNFRLEKAKSMLEMSSLSISEIAYSNGFSSPNYFSTAFKNKYGTSPVMHRKSL